MTLFEADFETVVAYLRKALHQRPEELIQEIPPGQRAAAVLAPLYLREGRPHVLFTRRAETLSAHRGEIAFPGGAYDPDDGPLEQTALREAREELGLAPERVELLGPLAPVWTVVSNFTVVPFVGLLPDGPGELRPNQAEVAAVIEAPLAELANPTIFHAEEWVRGGVARPVYFFEYGPHRIWGATARMLFELLELLRAGGAG
jgi:8-oxo-dGTP pyrophosphatase MutT (NUDIX family)